MQGWPITGERRFAPSRVMLACLIGSLAIALAGCGEDGATAAAASAAPTPNTSAGSTVSPPVTDTAGESSKDGGSPTIPSTSPVPPPPPPKAATTSITLGWVPPTRNSDGSLITNLAGYKIHYGTASSEYTQTIALQNAGLTRYVVDNLPSGTYYFAITAYNSQGIESPMSGEVSTIVD